MTNEEILKKSIEKAGKNGFNLFNIVRGDFVRYDDSSKFWKYKKTPHNVYASLYEVIFSHNFAKAFWGTHAVKNDLKGYEALKEEKALWLNQPIWEYHLQQMVLYQNPLEYLENFL